MRVFDRVPLIVSVSNAEGPPVPIPNTEVKLCSAEDTYLATDRENRSMPTSSGQNNEYSSLAQSVERMTVNHDVAGSSPAGGAIKPFKFICTFSSVGRATDS